MKTLLAISALLLTALPAFGQQESFKPDHFQHLASLWNKIAFQGPVNPLTPEPPAPVPQDPCTQAYQIVQSTSAVYTQALAAETAKTLELKQLTSQREDAHAKKDKAEKDYVAAWNLAHPENPINPTPTPTPTPPTPTPVNPPAPVPVTPSNLRVLFTYDVSTFYSLPVGQQQILTNKDIRTYLDAHCPLEAQCRGNVCPLNAAKLPSYLFCASSIDGNSLPNVWQGAFSKAITVGQTQPWMIVVDQQGNVVASQSWPATPADTLTLLKKFGG